MGNLWSNISSVLGTVHVADVFDIGIIAYLIYHGIKLVRETRAAQLVKGIAILLLLSLLADELELRTLGFLMNNLLNTGLVVMVIVFQPELRRALEQVGRSRIGKLNVFASSSNELEAQEGWKNFIEALVDAAASLSRQKIGALVVIEQKTRLGEIINTGTIIDSTPTAELIGNIFFPNSPLHDGAMIVRDARLHAAGCFLPLSDNSEISRELGTRHRAALGVSEMSDALVVVVSEETGYITVCQNGHLTRGISLDTLRETLNTQLLPAAPEPSEKKFEFWRGRKNHEN